jgi:UDP-glucoronosyl and UDP-glucosyl transferase
VLLEAIRLSGVRAIVSQGWAGLGVNIATNPNVFLLGSSCPHSWLFDNVSAVIHHGGAGTTAAGLYAGKPTVIIPYFGDQPFWGNIVYRYGAGPQPIPGKEITAQQLAAAIRTSITDESMQRRALELGSIVRREQGKENAIDHFHRRLPNSIFKGCEAARERLAVWRYIKMTKGSNINVAIGAMTATVLVKEKLIDSDDLRLLRHIEYDVAHHGPYEPLSGAAVALGDLLYDAFKGMGEICYGFVGQPVAGSRRVWEKHQREKAAMHAPLADKIPTPMKSDGSNTSFAGSSSSKLASKARNGENSITNLPGRHAVKGALRIGKAVVCAPGAFTLAMARGAHNTPKLWGDRTIRPHQKVTGLGSGMKEGVKELFFGVSDGISGLFMQPALGFVEAGAAGFAKGVGKGVLGLPVKFYAGEFDFPKSTSSSQGLFS